MESKCCLDKQLLGGEAPALWHLVGHPPQATHLDWKVMHLSALSESHDSSYCMIGNNSLKTCFGITSCGRHRPGRSRWYVFTRDGGGVFVGRRPPHPLRPPAFYKFYIHLLRWSTHTHLDKTYSTFCAKFMTKNVPCKFETTAFQRQKEGNHNTVSSPWTCSAGTRR